MVHVLLRYLKWHAASTGMTWVCVCGCAGGSGEGDRADSEPTDGQAPQGRHHALSGQSVCCVDEEAKLPCCMHSQPLPAMQQQLLLLYTSICSCYVTANVAAMYNHLLLP